MLYVYENLAIVFMENLTCLHLHRKQFKRIAEMKTIEVTKSNKDITKSLNKLVPFNEDMIGQYEDILEEVCRNEDHREVTAILLDLPKRGHSDEAQQIAVQWLAVMSPKVLLKGVAEAIYQGAMKNSDSKFWILGLLSILIGSNDIKPIRESLIEMEEKQNGQILQLFQSSASKYDWAKKGLECLAV
jgi:hypothetical protein